MDFERNDSLSEGNISTILEELVEYIDKSSRVPLTGKVMVDGNYILEIVDKINAKLPEEMKQAKQVLDQSDKILESIEARGKSMLDEARAEAERIVQETEIVKMAQQEAEKIVQEATEYGENMVNKYNEQANQMIDDAEAYVDSLLTHLEANLDKVAAALKSTRANFEQNQQPDAED
ncbi:MAG TPA: hypothetical protein IAB00_01345 [Candidatus Avidehalobacter gallistercoris]|uniref:ATPase n=1 Tax=Candidatus Avidehalobacter gallistercoris TaxID=2840694 RepID=A0A9D1HJ10_9FIRM|nr:hypothetical protein [Candidatus Avidehalobacter gallistercoris]